MNVEFEPSLSHIKVNELMNATLNSSVSVSPFPHKHILCLCSVCGFVYFIIHSCISSLDGVGRAGYDHELLVGAFLLMLIALHINLLRQEISCVVLIEDSNFIFLYPLYFVLHFSPSLL